MAPKVPPKNTSTPHKNTSMTSEENEDFKNRLTQLQNQVDEMSSSMLKHVHLTHSHQHMENKMEEHRYQMEIKMNENREHMENKMEELKKSMSEMLLHTLDDKLPKGDNNMQGIHENVEEIKIVLELLHTHLGFLFPKVFICLLLVIIQSPIF
jgi:hypothetical protein